MILEGKDLQIAERAMSHATNPDEHVVSALRLAAENGTRLTLTPEASDAIRDALDRAIREGAFPASDLPAVRGLYARKFLVGAKLTGAPLPVQSRSSSASAAQVENLWPWKKVARTIAAVSADRSMRGVG